MFAVEVAFEGGPCFLCCWKAVRAKITFGEETGGCDGDDTDLDNLGVAVCCMQCQRLWPVGCISRACE